jgi:mono/diheme cytochrome c family protein
MAKPERAVHIRLASPTVAVLLVAATVAAQTPPSATQSAPSISAGNAENGKSLYVKYSCYACHGYDGHGGAGARLVPMRMNLPGFSAYIKNPRQMPPYTVKVLSDDQAADLWAYIKSMPESPSAGSIPLLSRIISEK